MLWTYCLARAVGCFLCCFYLPGLWACVFHGGFVLFGLMPVAIFIGEVLSIFSLLSSGFGPRFLVIFGWVCPFGNKFLII